MDGLPMPRDIFDGGIVVASVITADGIDDDTGDVIETYVLLTLESQPPFYRVIELARLGDGSLHRVDWYEFKNIAHAVNGHDGDPGYIDLGGLA